MDFEDFLAGTDVTLVILAQRDLWSRGAGIEEFERLAGPRLAQRSFSEVEE